MAESFYPFVEASEEGTEDRLAEAVRHAARIAVYDDEAAAPRVMLVEPKDVRSYLEEITATVTRLSKEQGGSIPFMVIREIVENLIHAYFTEPTISILDDGDTIRFADQGPGIADKELALEYGTTSATGEMKRYIRGVGSGLPYAQQWLKDKGGTLRIEDNISRGTVVTISLLAQSDMREPDNGVAHETATAGWPNTPLQSDLMGTTAQQAMMPATAQPALMAPYGYVMQPMPYAVTPTSPQPASYPLPYPYASASTGAYAPQTLPQPSERGMLALGYLASHESVGPTELVGTFGHSQSTWTRELKALEEAGLVAKRGGQKRFLTAAGRALLTR